MADNIGMNIPRLTNSGSKPYYLNADIISDLQNKKTYNPQNSETEQEKHNHHRGLKIAGIVTGASVLSLILGGALLYKFSPKMITNGIKSLKTFALNGYEKASNHSFTKSFYKNSLKALDWTTGKINSINNFTSAKDIGFDRLCKSKFLGGENSFLAKANQRITKFFDSMAQNTVFKGYQNADRKFNEAFDLIYAKKASIPAKDWSKIEQKMQEVNGLLNDGFSNKAINARIRNTKDVMEGLDKKVLNRFSTLLNEGTKKSKTLKDNVIYLDDNLKFFSEDILANDKSALGKAVNTLKSNVTSTSPKQKGKMQELLELMKDKIPANDYNELVKKSNSATKALDNAIDGETVKYFDKFRDLKLGSAPTDVLTIAASSAMTGAVIAKADNKDERISKTLTKGIPIIGTVGTSLLLSARMVSGTKSLALGALSGVAISKLGEMIDKTRVKHAQKREMKFNERLKAELKKLTPTI